MIEGKVKLDDALKLITKYRISNCRCADKSCQWCLVQREFFSLRRYK